MSIVDMSVAMLRILMPRAHGKGNTQKHGKAFLWSNHEFVQKTAQYMQKLAIPGSYSRMTKT